MLSLTEASKETGKGRTTLFKAIKTGRLSATKNDKGEYQIDASELFRVYAPVKHQPLQSEQTGIVEIELYKKLLAQVEGERDYLRAKLDTLTAMITHQQDPAPEHKTESKLFAKLFGRKL